MHVCQRTHQGLVRTSNQDSLLADGLVFGVADGMGGHKGGETASRVAVQVIKNALHGRTPEEQALRLSVEAANRRVFEMSRHDGSLSGMGTTVTFLWEGGDFVLVAHVGDSRAYRLRDGKLEQMTRDHSIVAELLRNNVITAEMARNHPYKNVITRAVGIDPVVEPDILRVDKREGDLWLICSDGLYNMVEDARLAETLSTLEDTEAADTLLKLALDQGGTDNISFVLCRVAEVSAE